MGKIITSLNEADVNPNRRIIKPGEELPRFVDQVVRERGFKTIPQINEEIGAKEMRAAGGFQTPEQVSAREMRAALDSATAMTRDLGGTLDTPSNSIQASSATHHRITEPAIVGVTPANQR